MSDEKSKSKAFWRRLFSKSEALQEAQSYATLTFWAKTKNVLAAFFLGITLLSVSMSLFGGVEGFSLADIWMDAVLYVVFLPFIYMQHRWAMIASLILYALGKLVLIASGIGAAFSHLVFLMIAFSLTYKSVLVASCLRGISAKPIDKMRTGNLSDRLKSLSERTAK